jgi:hypothetical protein
VEVWLHLDYSNPQRIAKRRAAGWWVALVFNVATLSIAVFLWYSIFEAAATRNGWGQLGVFVIGMPVSGIQFLIFIITTSVSGDWRRDPLLWISSTSLLLNGGALFADMLMPHYGGC